MREFVNRYGVVLISGALVLAAVIWYFFGRSSTPPTGRTDVAYFIDEDTGEVSVQSSTEIAPLPNKDGKLSVVQLMKISCENGRNPVNAYYRKWTPEAKDKMLELRPTSKDPQHDRELQAWTSRGEWIRLPAAGSPWVPAASDEGEKVMEAVQCTNGGTPIAVFPP